MQYVGRAIGSVSTALSSINPSTLSGAIDIVVVEHPDGTLSCSPFHVRFGKFQLLRPSQKKIDVSVNGVKTNLPMKLGDGGEAFFVFETDSNVSIPENMLASPVLSAASSPSLSPQGSPSKLNTATLEEPELLDLGESLIEKSERYRLQGDAPGASLVTPSGSPSSSPPGSPGSSGPRGFTPTPLHSPRSREFVLERAKTLTDKLKVKNIPSKIDVNGDILLDMDGYKLNAQNIQDTDELIKNLLIDEFGTDIDIEQLLRHDDEGKVRINNLYEEYEETPPPTAGPAHNPDSNNYFKTLRLTSAQLQCLLLKPGENEITYAVNKGKAFLSSKLFLWKSDVPIVISDIDGTITKSDALGHVLTMIGRDWTHVGVARLFHDIHLNGFNILYLTARSSGQADSTRAYLKSIDQDGIKLPLGPVILSPDRTMAALRREVILKKPEVFKISCLRDFKSLYDDATLRPQPSALDESPSSPPLDTTPFYAGFGNRITDALSYRTVGIPSSRIFTINPDGEVHMELLELAGYKLSYVNIGELVDQFFPLLSTLVAEEKFSDVSYWRETLPELSESDEEEAVSPIKSSKTSSMKINADVVLIHPGNRTSGISSPRSPGQPISTASLTSDDDDDDDDDYHDFFDEESEEDDEDDDDDAEDDDDAYNDISDYDSDSDSAEDDQEDSDNFQSVHTLDEPPRDGRRNVRDELLRVVKDAPKGVETKK